MMRCDFTSLRDNICDDATSSICTFNAHGFGRNRNHHVVLGEAAKPIFNGGFEETTKPSDVEVCPTSSLSHSAFTILIDSTLPGLRQVPRSHHRPSSTWLTLSLSISSHVSLLPMPSGNPPGLVLALLRPRPKSPIVLVRYNHL